MSLNADQLKASVALYIQPKFPYLEGAKLDKYVASLGMQFGWMTEYAWDQTCKVVASYMQAGKLPVDRNYRDAYDSIRPSLPGGDEVKKCSGCDGERYHFGYRKHNLDGSVVQVCTPCARCNSGVTVDQKQIDYWRQNFTVATKDDLLAQRQKATDEYQAREADRAAKRPNPKFIDAEAVVSPSSPQPISAALMDSRPEPEPVKVPEGYEEY